MSGTFKVKNFEEFQHYKDRSPPWIKLYNRLLDDYEFGRLPDASKAHLLAIWLLASRYENKIPADPDWVARRINATCDVDLTALINSGFIIIDQSCSVPLAERKQTAIPEREREQSQRESREETESGFEDFFSSMPKQEKRKDAEPEYFKALKKTTPQILLSAAQRYAAQVKQEKAEKRFICFPATWLRDERWTDYANGHVVENLEEAENQRKLYEKHHGQEIR